MTDRPILFDATMVRALLDGRKTQTRRFQFDARGRLTTWGRLAEEWARGERGQRVWVREAWGLNHYKYERGPIPKKRPRELDAAHFVYFGTETDAEILHDMRRRPSIHMPRWFSRLTLAVTGVKVERLQEISRADAISEGCDGTPGHDTVCDYSELWDGLHGPGSWDANPWVVAITFIVHHRNIDAMEKAA